VAWRVVPLVGVVLFVGLGFGWRTWVQVRRTGATGMMLFRSGRRAQNVRDALFMVVVLTIVAQAVTVAVAPDALARHYAVPPGTVARVTGAALVFGAVGLLVAAQLDLGASWRIGIEEGARPGLVTTGFYRFCRNPIFLFMLLALAGLTLLVPTWLSLVLLAGTVVGIREQVVEEEAYLLRTYGDAYRAYARRVGRFLPGMGRLG